MDLYEFVQGTGPSSALYYSRGAGICVKDRQIAFPNAAES